MTGMETARKNSGLPGFTLSNLLSARSLLSHKGASKIKDAARDGPCAHGKVSPGSVTE